MDELHHGRVWSKLCLQTSGRFCCASILTVDTEPQSMRLGYSQGMMLESVFRFEPKRPVHTAAAANMQPFRHAVGDLVTFGSFFCTGEDGIAMDDEMKTDYAADMVRYSVQRLLEARP